MARYRLKVMDRVHGLAVQNSEIEKLYLSGELPRSGDSISVTCPENKNVPFGDPPIPGYQVRVFVRSVEHMYTIDRQGVPCEEYANVYVGYSS